MTTVRSPHQHRHQFVTMRRGSPRNHSPFSVLTSDDEDGCLELPNNHSSDFDVSEFDVVSFYNTTRRSINTILDHSKCTGFNKTLVMTAVDDTFSLIRRFTTLMKSFELQIKDADREFTSQISEINRLTAENSAKDKEIFRLKQELISTKKAATQQPTDTQGIVDPRVKQAISAAITDLDSKQTSELSKLKDSIADLKTLLLSSKPSKATTHHSTLPVPQITTSHIQQTYADITRNGSRLQCSNRRLSLSSFQKSIEKRPTKEKEALVKTFHLGMSDAQKKSKTEKAFNVSIMYVGNIPYTKIGDIRSLFFDIFGMDKRSILGFRWARVSPTLGFTALEVIVRDDYVLKFEQLLPKEKPILRDFDPTKPIDKGATDAAIASCRQKWIEKMLKNCRRSRQFSATRVYRHWMRSLGLWTPEMEEEANSSDEWLKRNQATSSALQTTATSVIRPDNELNPTASSASASLQQPPDDFQVPNDQ